MILVDLWIQLCQFPTIQMGLTEWSEKTVGELVFVELHILIRNTTMHSNTALFLPRNRIIYLLWYQRIVEHWQLSKIDSCIQSTSENWVLQILVACILRSFFVCFQNIEFFWFLDFRWINWALTCPAALFPCRANRNIGNIRPHYSHSIETSYIALIHI